MKENYRNLIRATLFLLCFAILLNFFSIILFPLWDGKSNSVPGINSFYKEPENSIDVLFIGSSSFRNGISPLEIWNDYGFTSYVRATSAQHPIVSYLYLLETLKYQKPKVVVLDAISLFIDFDVDKKEASLRRSIDPIKFSLEKSQMIREIVSYSHSQTYISYVFPITRYHYRWTQLGELDFNLNKLDQQSPYKGQYVTTKISPFEINKNRMDPIESKILQDSQSKIYIEKIFLICKERGIPVILATLPRFTKYNYENHVELEQLAEKYDLVFIDYNLQELNDAIGFDPATDLSDPNHVNIYGSVKISKNLGGYLKEHYDFPDRRNDPKFSNWNSDVEYLQELLEVK